MRRCICPRNSFRGWAPGGVVSLGAAADTKVLAGPGNAVRSVPDGEAEVDNLRQ